MAPISPEIEKIVCGLCSMAIDRLAQDFNAERGEQVHAMSQLVRGIVQPSALSMWPSGVALWQVFATWPHVTGSEAMVGLVAFLGSS